MAKHDLITWCSEMDAALRDVRAAGGTWAEAGDRAGVAEKTARRRARVIGLPSGRLNGGVVPGRLMVKCAATAEQRAEIARKGAAKRWRKS